MNANWDNNLAAQQDIILYTMTHLEIRKIQIILISKQYLLKEKSHNKVNKSITFLHDLNSALLS